MIEYIFTKKKYIPARAKEPCTLPPGRPTVNSISAFSNAETKSLSQTGTPAAYRLISEAFKDSKAAMLSYKQNVKFLTTITLMNFFLP